MSASLIETLGASLTPELLNSIGQLTPVKLSGAIGKVLGAALPTILSSIAGGAQQPGFLEKILGMANQVAGQGSLLPKLGNVIIAQGTLPAPLLAIGEKLLALLFGNKAGALAGALASLGGVQSSSATTLLGLSPHRWCSALSATRSLVRPKRDGSGEPSRQRTKKLRCAGASGSPGRAGLRGGDCRCHGRCREHTGIGQVNTCAGPSGSRTDCDCGRSRAQPRACRCPRHYNAHREHARCAPGCCGGLAGNTPSPRRLRGAVD